MNREACVWQACIHKADDALLDVRLVHKGRSYTKARVPLCIQHLMEYRVTQRVTLRAEFLFATERR